VIDSPDGTESVISISRFLHIGHSICTYTAFVMKSIGGSDIGTCERTEKAM